MRAHQTASTELAVSNFGSEPSHLLRLEVTDVHHLAQAFRQTLAAIWEPFAVCLFAAA
jgi:hypothetical protein